MELSKILEKYYPQLQPTKKPSKIQKGFYLSNKKTRMEMSIIQKLFYQPNFQSEHLNITNIDGKMLLIE